MILIIALVVLGGFLAYLGAVVHLYYPIFKVIKKAVDEVR